ncbi:hypothetical protein NL676_026436 [Syzygium grande]|nr:hypothetical protein NL676_026436 [Syzygium grande]
MIPCKARDPGFIDVMCRARDFGFVDVTCKARNLGFIDVMCKAHDLELVDVTCKARDLELVDVTCKARDFELVNTSMTHPVDNYLSSYEEALRSAIGRVKRSGSKKPITQVIPAIVPTSAPILDSTVGTSVALNLVGLETTMLERAYGPSTSIMVQRTTIPATVVNPSTVSPLTSTPMFITLAFITNSAEALSSTSVSLTPDHESTTAYTGKAMHAINEVEFILAFNLYDLSPHSGQSKLTIVKKKMEFTHFLDFSIRGFARMSYDAAALE